MVEVWLLFNIDKSELLGFLKLWEVFANGELSGRVRKKLVRPTGFRRRPQYSVTLNRARAPHALYWELDCMTYKAISKTKPKRRYSSDSDSSSDSDAGPDDTEGLNLAENTLRSASPRFHDPPSRFQHLPAEITSMIFDEIEEVITVVCLSLTNRHFFQFGLDNLIARLMHVSFWNGDRLICLDEDVPMSLLPKQVLTQEEIDALRMKAVEETDGDDWYYSFHKPGEGETPNLSRGLARKHYQDEREDNRGRNTGSYKNDSKLFPPAFWNEVERMNLIKRSLVEQIKLKELVDIERSIVWEYDDSRSDWALSNITTGEYVRADAILSLTAGLSLANVGKGSRAGRILSFAEIVGVNVLWYPRPDDEEVADDEFSYRGAWAGHRFEITTMNRLRNLPHGQHWKDVSDMMMEKMKKAWQLYFDKYWQEYL